MAASASGGSLSDKHSGPAVDPLRFKARAAALAVFKLYRSGCNLNQIAERRGISRQHAWKLATEGRELVHGIESGDPSWELSPRSRNALLMWGEGTTPEAVAKIDLTRVPNIGSKSREEILDWLARHAPAV